MGNSTCCTGDAKEAANTATAAELDKNEAMPVLSDGPAFTSGGAKRKIAGKEGTYHVTLNKSSGGKLGLDVDYMEGRVVLPIMAITGGLAEMWNKAHPDTQLCKGDSVVNVNGVSGNVVQMLEKCKSEKILELTLRKALTYDHLVVDLEKLVGTKNCGPILIRLSWHDAGVYSEGRLSGGCPNAVMRFTDSGEGTFGANKGLPTVALGLLAGITEKYVPELISHADLWALAANVAIRMMGGPDIPTRFGRVDAKSSAESVASQEGRLPDGDKGAGHLREIFHNKGFDDKAIVALSGAHTVGACHTERSGFNGKWTEDSNKFDNSYYKDLLAKTYTLETTSAGCPQHRHGASGTIMLTSDLALVQEPAFKKHVDRYAENEDIFFTEFTESWVKMQELGYTNLRDIL